MIDKRKKKRKTESPLPTRAVKEILTLPQKQAFGHQATLYTHPKVREHHPHAYICNTTSTTFFNNIYIY
jgi:hypothetical protein